MCHAFVTTKSPHVGNIGNADLGCVTVVALPADERAGKAQAEKKNPDQGETREPDKGHLRLPS
jgi:hypothetical protein